MADEGNELIERIEKLTRLVACAIVDGRPQMEQIELLSRAGLQPKEIAAIIGTTANTVRVGLTNLRKRGARKRVRKRRIGKVERPFSREGV